LLIKKFSLSVILSPFLLRFHLFSIGTFVFLAKNFKKIYFFLSSSPAISLAVSVILVSDSSKKLQKNIKYF